MIRCEKVLVWYVCVCNFCDGASLQAHLSELWLSIFSGSFRSDGFFVYENRAICEWDSIGFIMKKYEYYIEAFRYIKAIIF